MYRCTVAAAGWAALTATAADPRPAMTAAERAFDAAVRTAAKKIEGAKSYSLTAVTEWETSGTANPAKGGNRLKVIVARPDRFRIDLAADGAPAARYVAAADGKTLTRLFAGAEAYSVTTPRQPFYDVQTDGLTVQTLRSTGCSFLVTPDIHGAVMAQAARVEDLGSAKVGGRAVRRFRARLVSGRVVDVGFAGGLPVDVKTVVTVPVGDDKDFRLTMGSRLKWDFGYEPAAADFAVKIPDSAKKVANLAESVYGPAGGGPLGKPAAGVTFVGLGGAKVDLAAARGDAAMVVFFWASWTIPSDPDLKQLREIIGPYRGKGVKFLSVNVGEGAEFVKAFVAEHKYQTRVVRDPEGGAAKALSASIPSAVVIGKDGKVRAITRGLSPAAIDRLRRALKDLGG